MTENEVELTRRGFAANRSGPDAETVEVVLALTHPEIEFTSRLSALGTAYRGLEGVRRYFSDMAEAWSEWRNDIHSITGAGPDALLVDFTFRAVGEASGATIELRQAAVVRFTDGLVRRMHVAATRTEALRAAGLPED